jgi:hypothetical protein
VLAGLASWDDVDAALDDQRDFLARWVQEQVVQTNEVQRSWALLPGFLTVSDGRPFDLLELGPSAGLNLMWDRYRYSYSTGTWGTGALELTGNDRVPPPAELLHRNVSVSRRRGIDLNPVDVTTEHGARLLEAFVWADQTARLDRVRRAIAVTREDAPQLMKGDYVESLPALLADRREGTQLVVFQTASTMYLDRTAMERLREALHHAARHEPLVYLTGSPWSSSNIRRVGPGGSRSSTFTASGSTGDDDHLARQRAAEARAQAPRQALAREAGLVLRRR